MMVLVVTVKSKNVKETAACAYHELLEFNISESLQNIFEYM